MCNRSDNINTPDVNDVIDEFFSIDAEDMSAFSPGKLCFLLTLQFEQYLLKCIHWYIAVGDLFSSPDVGVNDDAQAIGKLGANNISVTIM